MHWEVIVALIVMIPVILIPAAFVWYLNIGGIFHAVRQAQRERGTAREKEVQL